MTFSARYGLSSTAGWFFCAAIMAGRFAEADERRIYRCEAAGRVTYSDVACSGKQDAVEVERRLNTFDADPPAKSSTKLEPGKSTKPVAQRNSPSIAEEQARHKEKCKALAARSDAITKQLWTDESLRSRSKRSEQLKAQQAKVDAERRQVRCR